mmetsp:Transcript_10867/g.30046  ORF Transcript_10867/g.30046 Transcript_10867/m.30046 type:complete len:228 (+) Transcript_10867:101-784(+)
MGRSTPKLTQSKRQARQHCCQKLVSLLLYSSRKKSLLSSVIHQHGYETYFQQQKPGCIGSGNRSSTLWLLETGPHFGNVVLVIFFCHVESRGWFNIHILRISEVVLHKLVCHLFLLWIQSKNGGSVLSLLGIRFAHFLFPFGQNILKRNHRRIVFHENGFRVIHNCLIGRIELPSTAVPHKTPRNAFHGFKLGLRVPKSSQSHARHFHAGSRREGNLWTKRSAARGG